MTDFYTLDDQGQVAALKQFSETALSHWSLEGSQLSLIKYRENAVFEVLTSEQKRYALRIHRYGYHSDEELDAELRWMKALQEDVDASPSPRALKEAALGAQPAAHASTRSLAALA